MIDRRLPSHLAILVGISAGAYAVSLAGVTALQSGADARLNAARTPIRLAAEQMASNHDRLEAAYEAAARRYSTLADRYGQVGDTLGTTEDALGTLAERTAALTKSAASMPTRFSLPTVRSAPRSVSVSAPKTHATTRASGG